jgi:Family of unknown function (DUF6527)
MEDAPFRRVENYDAIEKAGDGCWSTWHGAPDRVASLVFMCPCGCGMVSSIRVSAPPVGTEPGPVWSWNGDKDKPTTTPSILRLDGCKWHGFLTDGVFRSC